MRHHTCLHWLAHLLRRLAWMIAGKPRDRRVVRIQILANYALRERKIMALLKVVKGDPAGAAFVVVGINKDGDVVAVPGPVTVSADNGTATADADGKNGKFVGATVGNGTLAAASGGFTDTAPTEVDVDPVAVKIAIQ